MSKATTQRVDLISVLEVIDRHLTSALCEATWEAVRISERQRKWTLELLLRFWIEVTVQAPRSLRDALTWATGQPGARFSGPEATPEAFFARSQSLRYAFFDDAFRRFLEAATRDLPARFCRELHGLLKRFPSIIALDGSGLDPVARRLKALHKDRRVPLPGALLAAYDLCRGVPAAVDFDPNVYTAEINRAKAVLSRLPSESLIVADRLYGVPAFFAALSAHQLFGVCRLFGPVSLANKVLLGRHVTDEGVVEDYEVLAGTKHDPAARCQLRLIVLKVRGRVKLQVLTNVLDRSRLSAPEALKAYRARWSIERMFSDLKEVLNLSRFYAANINAVGMQVFSAAIMYTGLRVAQSAIAAQAKIEPEEISTKKLFPKVAAAAQALAAAQYTLIEVQQLNRGVVLKLPTLREMPFAFLLLSSILREIRSEKRTTRRKCPARGMWRAMPGIRRRKRRS